MTATLEAMRRAPFLEGVGLPGPGFSPSQGLMKLDGYRELFDFYRTLLDTPTLPESREQTARLLDGRDIATLYEYWVFVRVLVAVCEVLKVERPSVLTNGDEMGVLLPRGLGLALGEVAVTFNRGYRGRSQDGSYSTALRPDVVLRVGSVEYAFDAKYRMDTVDLDSEDDDDATERVWKRADIYKMHTYRDAISGISAAFVVYPGDSFAFFESTSELRRRPEDLVLLSGVGAVPLRPDNKDHQAQLVRLIARLLAK